MVQLFALFVLCLGFSGFVLAFDFFDDKLRCGEFFQEQAVKAPRFIMILAVLTGVLSILKIIFVYSGDIPVIGDIVPAAAGILSALMLFADYSAKKAEDKAEELTGLFARINVLFLSRRTLIGIIVVLLALVHFILPQVPAL